MPRFERDIGVGWIVGADPSLAESAMARPTNARFRRVSSGTAVARLRAVPEISRFFGIVVRMYYQEHEPRHFHAEHRAQEGKFDFDGNQIVGNITSKNALDLIRQWAQLNRSALDANWSNIIAGRSLDRIRPLE